MSWCGVVFLLLGAGRRDCVMAGWLSARHELRLPHIMADFYGWWGHLVLSRGLGMFRADALFAFNAKAPRWLDPLRSLAPEFGLAGRQVFDAAFAVCGMLSS
jgi:hypothetical protein